MAHTGSIKGLDGVHGGAFEALGDLVGGACSWGLMLEQYCFSRCNVGCTGT